MRRHKTSKTRSGYTLLEVLIVVAVISLVATILLPYFLDTLHKAKQKRTLADMHTVATAMTSWWIDQAGAAAAGRSVRLAEYPPMSHAELADVLFPVYLHELPEKDGWTHPYDYYWGNSGSDDDDGGAGWKVVMGIRSRGRDGEAQGTAYTWGDFQSTLYDHDIVWADGVFVTWPGEDSDSDSDDG